MKYAILSLALLCSTAAAVINADRCSKLTAERDGLKARVAKAEQDTADALAMLSSMSQTAANDPLLKARRAVQSWQRDH